VRLFANLNVVLVVGVRKNREAARLVTPELVVVDQVGKLLVDRSGIPSGGARLLKLPRGFPREILQLDPLRVAP
jgi:hypothetical protein